MPKASPLLRAFNGGVVSELIGGRTDLDKYGVLLRQSSNMIPATQGPIIRRSGTELRCPVYNEAKRSHFLEFVFSNNVGQSYNVEAADLRFRWHSDAGILAYTPVVITAEDAASATMKVTAAGHACSVGDQVVLAGFDYSTNLNGAIGNVTAVAVNVVTTDIPRPAVVGSLATATLARVYHIVTTYLAADVPNIRYTGDRDTLYLFCDGYAPRTLQRYGAYDWRLTEIDWIDGPYDNVNETSTRLTLSASAGSTGTGNVVPVMTADNLPAPYVASAAAGANPYKAFDGDRDTYWDSATAQAGLLKIDLGVGVIVDGYSIDVARANNDASYKSLDYAPGTWTFEGSDDDATYDILDSKVAYVAYNNLHSLYFKLKNAHAYRYYRIVVTQLTRNGNINCRIGGLHLTARAKAAATVTASAVTGINQDTGFKLTDIGRLLRIQGIDALWYWLKITAWTSTTVVTAEVKQDVLPSLNPTTEWRLGLFSATTGFPISGTFFEDRLCMGGMSGYPDWLVCSVQGDGKYSTIAQTDPDGTVNDDNGIVVRVNARRLGRIVWVGSDNRSLLLGTESGEWQVSSADLQAALSARTAKARRVNARGSASVEPVFVDRQGLYVQRGKRTLREISYSFDIDGYKAPSMSLLASHLGVGGFEQIVFAQEPLAVAWLRTADGKLIGFTYNRDENVTGWHEHDVGGFVESLSVLPASNGLQDILWLIVRRTIGGVTRRFVERMAPVWDFNSTLATAFFADCALRYQGAAINKIYGLGHAIGHRVVGLADGSPIVPQVVAADGSITLPHGKTTTNIVLGFGYDAYGESMRLEAGAGDGTAQGKTKRITGATLRLWQSGGGKFGTRDAKDEFDTAGSTLEDIDWLNNETTFDEAAPLFTGDTKFLRFPDGYNQSGTVIFFQDGDVPLPFNVVSMAPQLHTQDR